MEKKSVGSILEKWSSKYKRSIDCSNPQGFSQKAHCAGRRKRKSGGKTKSRPVESFTENTMENLSEFFIKEVNQAVKKEMVKTKLKETSKDLFEAVNLHTKLKKENAPTKKIELAERAIELAELKVLEGYDELNERCECGEGEGRMLKGQLVTLMANAEKLYHMISEEDQFEDWVQAKVTTAEDYINSVYSYLTYYNGDGEADESDWDGDDWNDKNGGNLEDWDEVDEEDFEVEELSPAESIESAISNLEDALDSTVDDDELFDSQKRI